MTLPLAELGDAREWLRLALVPAAVWAASLAARRWGHAVSGYLGGMPLIGGPITLYLALDFGPAFAARSATFTLAAILGQAAHLLTFAHVARRLAWPFALAAGWASYAAVGLALARLEPSAPLALALGVGGLAAAGRFLPREERSAAPPLVPRAELWLRLAAAFGLAVGIVAGAHAFGPVVSGILLSVPVTGSILPPFTRALYGNDAVARLTRGFVVGLSGFTAFFATLAFGLTRLGVAATFVLAACAALAAAASIGTLARRPSGA